MDLYAHPVFFNLPIESVIEFHTAIVINFSVHQVALHHLLLSYDHLIMSLLSPHCLHIQMIMGCAFLILCTLPDCLAGLMLLCCVSLLSHCVSPLSHYCPMVSHCHLATVPWYLTTVSQPSLNVPQLSAFST